MTIAVNAAPGSEDMHALLRGSGHPLAQARIENGRTLWSNSTNTSWNTGYHDGEAGWRISENAIECFTDMHGICPIYYAHGQDHFCCSPSLAAVAHCIGNPTLDPMALSSFFRIGFFCDEETPFNEIRVLPIGASATWSNGTLTFGAQTAFPSVSDVTPEEALDGYQARFQQSITRLLEAHGRPEAMLLSGGKDSRHILLELHRQDALPDVVATMQRPNKDDTEVRCARLVAQHVGCRHETIHQDPTTFANLVRTALDTDFETDEHDWFRSAFRWLASHATTSMDGLAGERLSGQYRSNGEMLDLLTAGRVRDATSMFMATWGKPLGRGRHACSELGLEFIPDAGETTVRAAINACLASPNPFQQFWLRTRTRREVARAPLGMGRNVGSITFPYLDPDLYTYICALPPKITREYAFHAEVIRKAYPDTDGMPYASTGFVRTHGLPARLLQSSRMRIAHALHARNPLKALERNPIWWQCAYVAALKQLLAATSRRSLPVSLRNRPQESR